MDNENPFSLLIVDDSPEDREAVLRTLGRSRPGWRLIAAGSGEEALARFAELAPDLVLLDLNLPDADGIELLPALSGGDGRPVPVVLLTGRGDQAAAVKALKLGARDYLIKDVAGSYLATLAETLERVLDEHQVDQESRRLHREAAGRQERLAQIAERRGQDVQRLEYRMRRVVEQSMDGLLVVARDGGVLVVNPVAEYLLSCDDGLLRMLTAGEPPRDGSELSLMPVKDAPGTAPITVEIRTRPLQWDGTSATLFALHDITARKAAERALAESEQRFRRLVESAPDAVVISDREGRIRIVNDEAQRMFGYPAEQLVGQLVEILLPEAVRERHVQHRSDFLHKPTIRVSGHAPLLYARRRDGSEFPVEITLSPMESEDGTLVTAIVRDISARVHTEQALRLRNRAVESAQNGILLTEARNGDNPIVYVNPAFEGITGYSAAEAMGRNPRFLARDDRQQPDLENIRAAVREHHEGSGLLRNYRKDGSLFWNHLHVAPVLDESGEVSHYVGVLSDVTNEKRYLDELEHQATHDTLTGLPNRVLLADRLRHALALGVRYERLVAVLFLDLDHFKRINDALGHRVGDQVLETVGQRLRSCAREGDTVARYGGDEFVLVLSDLPHTRELRNLARRLQTALAEPLQLEGEALELEVSIGAAVAPQDGEDPETLLRNADTAMYRAKELGRNRLEAYNRELGSRVSERLGLEMDLRRALEHGGLELHYQPQICLSHGRCVGVEALARWSHPERGPIPPDHFIPMAEESGLILVLGQWVLREACTRAAALPSLEMAVNVSARQLEQEDFVDSVRAVLAATGLAPQRLELELTESVVMGRPGLMLERLRDLKTLGVKLALDDFGTGYSSLAYLKRFPFDRLKIDRSFVQDLPDDPNDVAIAATIVAIARSLGLGVVAEGVENEAQRAFLLQEGCDCGQGWLFARPLPAPELERFLARECSHSTRRVC